jgi:hypothetical protein
MFSAVDGGLINLLFWISTPLVYSIKEPICESWPLIAVPFLGGLPSS